MGSYRAEFDLPDGLVAFTLDMLDTFEGSFRDFHPSHFDYFRSSESGCFGVYDDCFNCHF